MLCHPFLNEIFEPNLMWFIGVFNVYDLEHTLGVELDAYDPNDESDRAELIKKYCLDLSYLSYRHKYVLLQYLAAKLSDGEYDFQSLFEIDEDEASSWPRGEWYELEDPPGLPTACLCACTGSLER
ncbi:hypothetical protein [Pseudomonas sp. MYb118]|uniref:hypothetical protein n=1 Tax=Pseudomonas sp. MYb118 TaxID=1848720 RepID=UPI0034CEBD46